MHRLATIIAVSTVGISVSLAPALAAETRCGRYWNPTPGNLWLMDKYHVARLPATFLPFGAILLWILGQIAVLGPALRAAAEAFAR